MAVVKKDIEKILKTVTVNGDSKTLFDGNLVSNIMVFGDQIDIDILMKNPTLQARKKVQGSIEKLLETKLDSKVKVKINTKIEKPNSITPTDGTTIKGIDSIIAISSGKGGVGKSTVTANIAVTLAQMGCKVGILDADIYGPSIPAMFDLEGERPLSVSNNGESKMKPIENYGVKVLSIGFFTKPDQAVIWRGPMATKALKQMIFDSAWGELDFLLVDLPPGTGDIHLSIVQSIPLNGAIVVSTPQNVALADARKGISMFRKENINVPLLGIIENMSFFVPKELPNNKYYIFGKEGAKNLAEDKNVPFLGELPLVQSIREASDIGRPAALQESTVVKEYLVTITQNLVEQLLKRNTALAPTKVVKITNMVGCSAIK
jgi:ATP-binding protein involved in chromosome partitioning